MKIVDALEKMIGTNVDTVTIRLKDAKSIVRALKRTPETADVKRQLMNARRRLYFTECQLERITTLASRAQGHCEREREAAK
jgi:hypothetical protein